MIIQKDLTKEQMVSMIGAHEVFAGLKGARINELKRIIHQVSSSKGDVLFSVGEQPHYLYFLVSGALRLNFPDGTYHHLKTGELIGEIGLLNGDFRLGTLIAEEDSVLIAICGTKIFDTDYIPAEITLHIIKILSRRVTNYLRSIQQTSTEEILKYGENEKVEFKSTLRWNLRSGKKDRDITFATLKNIVAFLNTEGGIILIGVNDEGLPIGLNQDKFENDDKLFLFLTSNIRSYIGPLFLAFIHFHVETIQGCSVLRIDIKRSDSPAYLRKEKEDLFYIRTGPSVTPLRTSLVYDYINKHFIA